MANVVPGKSRKSPYFRNYKQIHSFIMRKKNEKGTERYPHNRARWASDRRHVCRCDTPACVSLGWQH
jgi:hypothetical protein